MKGYFDYTYSHISDEANQSVLFSFLFKPTGLMDAEALAEAIEQCGLSAPYPDIIVIQCMEKEQDAVIREIDSVSVQQSLRRISKRISLYLAAYDRYGQANHVRLFSTTKPSINVKKLLKDNHQIIINVGLKKLFNVKGVIQKAPSGFTFIKPSGDRSQYFLKTEEALSDSENVQFVAFCLLPRIQKRNAQISTQIKSIYVDTMGIASVGYALRELHWGQSEDATSIPRIESFHSHEGLDSLGPPMHSTSFCLISASQSMNLQTKWKTHTKTSDLEVVTLLTNTSARNASEALHSLDILTDKKDLLDPQSLHEIRIIGEKFYPDQIKPRKVLLRQKYHTVNEAYQLAVKFHSLDLFKVQCRNGVGSSKVHPIYLDMAKLSNDDHFKKWLDNIVDQYVPISTQAVICQDDESSYLLAKLIISRIREKYNIPYIQQEPIKDTELSTKTINKDGALVIVAATVGKGSKLLSISRDLRDVHTGARCYVVGAQIAETKGQINVLKQNLKSPSSNANWRLETFISLAVGKYKGQSFATEELLFRNLDTNIDGVEIRQSKLLGSDTGMMETVFWPSSSSENPLQLRSDFAYWPNIQYEPNAKFAAWIFCTIASMLQKAREDKSLPPDCQLSTEAYQNVILDPENFLRYNDGIIQAAILRAADPNEIDYSCSVDLSNTMKNILLKIFEYYDKDQGEASFEFALALSTGRLKIQNTHLEEVIQITKNRLTNSSKVAARTLLTILTIRDQENAQNLL